MHHGHEHLGPPPTPKPGEKPLPSSRRRFLQYRKDRNKKDDKDAQTTLGPDGTEQSVKPVDKATRRRYLRQYLQWLRPYVGNMALVFTVAIAAVGMFSVKPIFSAWMIDKAVLNDALPVEQRIKRMAMYGSVLIGLTVLSAVAEAWRTYLVTVLNAKFVYRVRQNLHDHVLRLPLSDLSQLKAGGVVSRLSGDVDATTGLIQMAVISPGVALVQAAAALGIIVVWNWKLAMAAMAVVPPMVLAHGFWVRGIRPIYRSMRGDRQAVDARVTETFGGIRVVRSFRREVREEQDYAVGHHTVIRKSVFAHLLEMGVNSAWDLLMPAITVVVVWYGGYLLVHGQATVGELFAFQWYVFLLLGPVMRIVTSMSQTQQGMAAMERVFDLLDKPKDKPDAPGAVDAPQPVRTLSLENVDFSYRPGTPVLQQVSLDVQAGSMVALVGPSGAGKTTLTDLIARFHDPVAGRILLNGVDLRQIKLDSYRRLFGIVEQDVFLFDGTVRDNIAYGRRTATLEQIQDAARRASAHDFITAMPRGYDTLIGERGLKLSGGQRQRLSIARALLADPAILILDEATSNLDTENEQLIQAALRELYRGRTTFVIAHRLSTVTHADVIVVMDQGRIVDRGTHESLMGKPGLYRDMVERQRQSFDIAGAM
ncbi:MAG: ABC transporter ATP-binding protein [Phycisphaeraceae bacterium]|nr:ABC transporter ATP-binding protein [Phycisphaeraceae bacterium]